MLTSGLREDIVTRRLVEDKVTSSDYISTSEKKIHLIITFHQ